MTTRTAGRTASLALAAALALAVSACGKESDRAADPAGSEPGASATAASSGTPTGTATAGGPGGTTWPEFAPRDYTYRLRVLCYCPQVGPVEVTVRDGAVVSATTVGGRSPGAEAPDYARLSINDIIAGANDPKVSDVEVVWPEDQDHPTSVTIDRIAMARDDEVTYTIRKVVVADPASGE